MSDDSAANSNSLHEKPKPLKVFGRTHYACTRCKLSKIKCSGEKPACSNCKSISKPEACVYPTKDRKIVIMESDLNRLHDRVESLENMLRQHHVLPQESMPFREEASTHYFQYQPQPQSQPQLQPQPQQLPHQPTLLSPGSASMVTISSASTTADQFPITNVNFEDFYSQLNVDSYESLKLDLLKVCQQLLPDKQRAMTLVDKIYSTYSSEFYLVDIVELRDILDRAYTVLAHQPYDPAVSICQLSLCYLFIIFAFGEQLLATHIVSTSIKDFPGMQYYLLAEHLFPLTREGVDFKFIQSALLLGFYAANLNRYSTVYNYLGVAARSAVALGYHRQPLNKKSDLIFYEKAKQLWWSVFVIDTTWATKTVHFQFTDTDVDLPTENMSPLVGNHNFDNNILEVNVHLTKYVAKFVRLIYGPNMRTFSINYINTSQFNQKLLLKNIVASSQDLIRNFEDSFLNPQFATTTIINPTTGSRNLANLFLRYHQLIILITKPLLSLMVDPSSYLTTSPIIDKENLKDVEATMARGILTSCATVDIISHLFVNEKVFILGFWDSQHLFSALILLISISCIGHQPHRSAHQVQFRQVDQGIALLKFMAERGNINAASCMDKLVEINRLLVTTPEVQYSLNLDVDVKKVLDIPKPHDNLYNPLKSSPLNKTFQSIGELGSLETYLPRSESSPYMETALFKVVHEIQSWNS